MPAGKSGVRKPIKNRKSKVKNKKMRLKYLIIHCTATPAGREVSADDIRRWHLSPVSSGGRGWRQVGYSNLFTLSGLNVVLVGDNGDNWVDAGEITNGVAGINGVSKHIVYAGGTDAQGHPKDTRTDRQKKAMSEFVKQFVEQHPDILVAGHNQFANKACPSFDVRKWLQSIGVAEKNRL
jgi:hypothetical protein